MCTATVSRALRNDDSISAATRARVIEGAAKLGYRLPPATRRRKASTVGHSTCVGVLIGHAAGFHGDPSEAGTRILAGLSDAAVRQNVDLSVHFVPPESAERILDPDHQPPAMRARQLNGLVLLYPLPTEIVRELSAWMPCVSVVHHHANLPVDCIDTDQIAAVGRLVEHLYALGHRRIGFVGWGRRLSWEYRRCWGYSLALMRLGLDYRAERVINLEGERLNEPQAAEGVAQRTRAGVTAWVCAADHVGYPLCRMLQRHGLYAGENVSVTGYDAMSPPPDGPPLTTIQVSFEDLGVAALRRLLHRIREPTSAVRDVLLRGDFIAGATTADVRGTGP